MKVEVLSPHGFCAGVKGALAKAQALVADGRAKAAPVYCLHEIVHNELVVADLRAKGLVFVESLNDVPAGATLLFSAHGVSPAVRDAAEARGLRIVDATCPFVARVHAAARGFAERGLPVVIIGKRDHAEVRGIVGEVEAVGGRVAVVADLGDAESLRVQQKDCSSSSDAERTPRPQVEEFSSSSDAERTPRPQVGVVSQTTMNADEVGSIVAALKARFTVETTAEVCNATKVRQDAVRAFAGDALLVLGSATSSNTKRLCEVARCRTFRAGTLAEVASLDFTGIDTLGITAGASTPEDFITAVVAAVEG